MRNKRIQVAICDGAAVSCRRQLSVTAQMRQRHQAATAQCDMPPTRKSQCPEPH